jgi:hypothetical protein
MTQRIFIFEIILKEVTPPVWRILEINRNQTLHELHASIQVAMGWKNLHLYSFSRGEGTNKVKFSLPDSENKEELITSNNTRKFKLRDIFHKPGDSIEYTYDYGDFWQHLIIFKGTTYENANFGYPRCPAGSRCCPPENIGGPPGYQSLLAAIETKNKKLLKEYDEWLGYRYNPDKFSANDNLIFFAQLARRIAK